MKSIRLFALLAALALLPAGGANAQNLLVNGDFESPVVGTGSYALFFGGSSFPGWTAVGSNMAILDSAYSEPGNGMLAFEAQSGNQSLDLTGINNSGPSCGVQQTVATTIGQTYDLSFYVGTANGGFVYSGPATVDLSIDGGARVSYTNPDFSSTPGFVVWQKFQTSFVATNTVTTITFYNGTPQPTCECGLDNVVLTSADQSNVLNDVTGQLRITRRPIKWNAATKRFEQKVTVANIGSSPIGGPAYLVLDSLTAGVTLTNANGVTANNPPLGSPFVVLPLGSDGILSPGEETTVLLQFTKPDRTIATYTPRVLAGSGAP